MTDEPVLRRALTSDADAVHELVQRSYGAHVARIGRRPAPMDQEYASVLGATDSWVMELDGRVVGVLVTRPADDHLLIENVAVAPELQGRGIGGRLLAVAEDHAAACGRPEVRLYTNQAMTENLAFYPRHGYRETGRAEQDGFGRVFFSKAVRPRS